MIEAQAVAQRDILVRTLTKTIRESPLFPQRSLEQVLTIDGKNLHERGLRATVSESGIFRVARLPFTVNGERAGQSPYWQLTRRKNSGVLVANLILYTTGHISGSRRMHIVASGESLDHTEIDTETAVGFAFDEINRLPEIEAQCRFGKLAVAS